MTSPAASGAPRIDRRITFRPASSGCLVRSAGALDVTARSLA